MRGGEGGGVLIEEVGEFPTVVLVLGLTLLTIYQPICM